jgi:hypothetical protein
MQDFSRTLNISWCPWAESVYVLVFINDIFYFIVQRKWDNHADDDIFVFTEEVNNIYNLRLTTCQQWYLSRNSDFTFFKIKRLTPVMLIRHGHIFLYCQLHVRGVTKIENSHAKKIT